MARISGPSLRLFIYVVAVAALAIALWYGRTRTAADIEGPVREIFPGAASLAVERGVYHVFDESGRLVGWAATGSSSGYGGPMLLVTGIDTLGQIVGVRVVEHRETPIFWRMVRVPEFLGTLGGQRFDEVTYDIGDVDWVTGATISLSTIVASTHASVAKVAGEAFDVRMPIPPRPFEFGLLEIVVLMLLLTGVLVHRVRGPARGRVKWVAQITGLVVLGFWKDSPITLAKIAALLSGFFPDPRTSLALYLLLTGFVVTSILFGRNFYCLYACPFGAAQRVVGLIGGKGIQLPTWAMRLMEAVRGVIVFAALFLAFLTLTPTLASYEPFAALFSLTGTTLQWLLLFLVMVVSLVIATPWCNLFCPMRTIEVAIQDTKRGLRRKRGVAADE